MGKKLYVGNLTYGVNATDLEQLFAQFGTVQSAQVIQDRDTGRSKGFGFVEMDTEAEAQREYERITAVDPDSPGYASFEEFRANSNLDVELSKREYSVGTRGLRPNLVGTAEQVADRIREFEAAGVDLLLIQSSPLIEELERIATDLFPLFD